MEIAPDRTGNFVTNVEIDGQQIRMMVDTGASLVALSDKDARAVGITVNPADYRYRIKTANGIGVAAKVTLASVQIGTMEVDHVAAFVMPPGALWRSLLGMSALSRLGSVNMERGRLVLRQ